MRSLVVVSLLACAAMANEKDEITRYQVTLRPGQYVDLDTGRVLAQKHDDADLTFPRLGTIEATLGATARAIPTPGPRRLAVLTGRNGYASVLVEWYRFRDRQYATLIWRLNRRGQGWFPEEPLALDTSWDGTALHASWAGPAGRFLVTARSKAHRKSVEVDEHKVAFRGLRPDVLYTIEVRRVGADGLRSAPAHVALRTGKQRVIHKDFGGGADTLHLDGNALGIAVGPRGVRAFAGGVRRMGQGLDLFHSLDVLPLHGYRRSLSTIQGGDVLAIRTTDGRYAKLYVAHETRNPRRMVTRCSFAESGGRSMASRPSLPEWSRHGAGVKLAWLGIGRATGYRVEIDGKQVYRGTRPTCVVANVAPHRVLRAYVYALTGDEVSDPLPIDFHTFSAKVHIGSLRLTTHRKMGYSFRDGAVVSGGDLRVLQHRNGRFYVWLQTGGGLTRSRFGEFPGPGVRLRERVLWLDSKDKRAICVLTAEGGMASVRIGLSEMGSQVLDYVYVPPRWDEDGIRVADGAVAWEPLDDARAYRIRINGRAWIRVEQPRHRLRLERNREYEVEVEAVTPGDPVVPLTLHHHTFSKRTHVVGGTNLIWRRPYSFSRGKPAGNGTGEFTIGRVGRSRYIAQAPYGVEFQRGSTELALPAPGKTELAERVVGFDVSELDDGTFLVGTADGGIACVRVQINNSSSATRCRYVYRRHVPRHEALARLVGQNPRARPEIRRTLKRLSARLAAGDPRVRAIAARELARLDRAAAPSIVRLQRESTDPEVNAALERWIRRALELYVY